MRKTLNTNASEKIAAFTLLEVMVVVAIMAAGLLLAVSQYPSGGNNTNMRLLGNEITTRLREARNLASERNSQAAFIFDAAERTYKIAENGKLHMLPEDISFKMESAAQLNTRPQEGRIVFFGDSSSTGGSIVLSENNIEYHIDVDWLTGRISTSRGSQ